MEPQIVKLPALTLLGISARFIGPMSPEANNQEVIPALFGQFFARRAELPVARDAFTYGACDVAPAGSEARPGEMLYLVSVSVAKDAPVPEGMTVWHLPARMYALFQHRGPITRIGETMGHIFGGWLPHSDYESIDGASLERYDERFGDGGETSELDILVPVQVRKKK